MTKVPESGKVKTRLEPFLTPDECCELATCFLNDSEYRFLRFNCQTFVAFTPLDKKDELESILHHVHILIDQKGKDLGERMFNAFDFVFRQDYGAILMIGTDSPTLPEHAIDQAFDYLEHKSNAVIGKTEDGGFYLIGLNSLKRSVFDSVDWGSGKVFDQTVEKILDAGLAVEFLETWYDVDVPSDLSRLKKELALDPGLAPKTYEWLKNF